MKKHGKTVHKIATGRQTDQEIRGFGEKKTRKTVNKTAIERQTDEETKGF